MEKKINILNLVVTLGMGGAEIILTQYIKALGNNKYNHFVYCFGTDGPVRGKIEKLNATVHFGLKREPIKNPIRFIISISMLIIDLLKYIKKNNISVIISHLSQANQLALAVSKLTNVVALPVIHNTMEFIDRRDRLDPRVVTNKIVNHLMFRLSDRIVAISPEIKNITQKHFGIKSENVILVKNGIVFDRIKNEKGFREYRFIIKNKINVIAVGRLTYQKAMEVLVKAIDVLIKKGNENLNVIIAGEGEQRSFLEKIIQENKIEKYIKLIGIHDDIIGIMKQSDIFVLPSRYEGLSIAMIEAMGCGLPIIASDAPGISDYIENGVNGLLFPVENHEILAEHIQLLASDKKLAKKLGKNSKNIFLNEYDMKKNIINLEKVIQKYHRI